MNEVGIEFKNFYVIGGYRFPEHLRPKSEEMNGMKYLGKIKYDKNVEDYIFSGKSLLELPSSSPAYQSVKEIMRRAGYG